MRSQASGGFLIRGLTRVDAEEGSIAINDQVQAGRTVQFHARDGATASAEMDSILGLASGMIPDPAGALLFSCNGRGQRLFDVPHHDAAALARQVANVPLAGFFAAGELGPVGGQNFLHGFTASIALFETRTP